MGAWEKLQAGLRGTTGIVWVAAVSVLFSFTACDSWPPHKLNVPSVSNQAYREYKLEIDSRKNIVEPACVVIDGEDIQLPLSSGASKVQENRTYSFYVWGYDAAQSEPLSTLWQKGVFSLDVLGVKASVDVPTYTPVSGAPQNLVGLSTNRTVNDSGALQSQNVLEVKVRSEDITGPFSIVAWFPDKYLGYIQTRYATNYTANIFDELSIEDIPVDAGSMPNPWGARRDIKVYNGDLRTHIVMADEREVESSFGKPFSKFFYVGRVFLRNRHPDKPMVVYTTSLEANALFYRPPNSNASIVLPNPRPADKGAYKNVDPFAPPPESTEFQLGLTKDEKKWLREKMTNQVNALKFELTVDERQKLYENALRAVPKALSTEPNGPTADQIVSQILRDKTNWVRKMAYNQIVIFWGLVSNANSYFATNSVRLEREASNIVTQQISALNHSPVFPIEIGPGADEKGAAKAEMVLGFERLTNGSLSLKANFDSLTNQIRNASLPGREADRLVSAATTIYTDYRQIALDHAMQNALTNGQSGALALALPGDTAEDGDAQRKDAYENLMEDFQQKAFGGDQKPANPFDHDRKIAVGPNDRALAFSESSDRQKHLDEVGYLWHDSYRPMTFQAVLNSLMYTHDYSLSAETIKVLQAAATVAGGMVGFGSVVSTFNSTEYLQSVNVFSTIFVPEVSKLILEDLNKHIRNLGDMAMDNVVIVPPSGSVDRYIFFPKGPIYNFVDEFDVDTPAYIKRIDNDDVSVQATLIDAGVNVQGGGLSSSALVDRALNEGQADENADLLKQATMTDNLRGLALQNLLTEINSALSGTSVATNGTRNPQRIQAEGKVCALVQSYKSQWGPDVTGVISTLLAKDQVNCDSSPPQIQPGLIPSVNLIPGAVSKSFMLPFSDPMGTGSLGITNTSSDAAVLPSANIQVTKPAAGDDGPVSFTARAVATASQKSDLTLTITFVATNRNGSNTLAVPATVHLPSFILNGTQKAGIFTLPDANTKAYVDAILPIYDSDQSAITNWSLTLQPPVAGWQMWNVTNDSVSPIVFGGVPALKSTLIIDGSLATNSSLNFTLTATSGTNLVAATNIVTSLGSP